MREVKDRDEEEERQSRAERAQSGNGSAHRRYGGKVPGVGSRRPMSRAEYEALPVANPSGAELN